MGIFPKSGTPSPLLSQYLSLSLSEIPTNIDRFSNRCNWGPIWAMEGLKKGKSSKFNGQDEGHIISKSICKAVVKRWPYSDLKKRRKKTRNLPPPKNNKKHFQSKIWLNIVCLAPLGTGNSMGLSTFQSWHHRGPPSCTFCACTQTKN